MIHALHGFLGLPTDWNFRFDLPVKTYNLWNYSHLSVEQWVEDFNLSDKEVLLGYSLGGRLALHALLQNPKKYKAAIFVSTHTGLKDFEKEDRLKTDREWAKKFETLKWQKVMEEWNAQPLFGKFSFPREEKNYSRKKLSLALTQWSLGLQKDKLHELEQLNIPILWIAGEKDSSYAGRAEKIKLKHPQSQVKIFSGCYHRVPWESPEMFTKVVNSFIAEVKECGSQ